MKKYKKNLYVKPKIKIEKIKIGAFSNRNRNSSGFSVDQSLFISLY